MGDRLLVLNNVILMQAMQAEMEAAAGVLVMMRRRRWRQRRASNFWVRPWLQTERRLLYGHYDRLMEELRQEDQQSFFNFIRMPPEMFDELLNRVGPRIQLQDTNFRRALEPGLKLAVTLRHLSSGDKYSTLQYDIRVARTTIVKFLPVVCQAIFDKLKDEVVICPTTPEQWRETANEFWRWNVPHACAALDGKHCAIRCPPNSGSPLCSLRWLTPIINFCGRMLGDTDPCQMPKFTMNPTWRRPWRTTQLDFHLRTPFHTTTEMCHISYLATMPSASEPTWWNPLPYGDWPERRW